MKDLNELNSYVTNIPGLFGVVLSTVEEVESFPPKSDEDKNTNYQTGFPVIYGTNPLSGGKYLMRDDFNKVGELATHELFFKKAGGAHTYSSDVANNYGGYQKDVVLDYYDGTYLKKVKSETSENKLDFIDKKPYGIDCIPSGENDVKWTTVNNIYGIDEDILHVGADFSRGKTLQEGLALSQDSLVVLGCTWYSRVSNSDYSGIECKVSISDTTIEYKNKGKTGCKVYSIPIMGYTLNYPSPLHGTTNYSTALFVKKGSSVKIEEITANGVSIDHSYLSMYVYPIKKTIGE